MPTLVLVSQKGPLPINTSFNAPMDGPAALFLSGSIWTQQPNSMIGIQVSMDGQNVGSASIFANPSSTHLAVPGVMVPIKLTFGAHKLTVSASTGATTSDSNDFFTVALRY